MTVLHDLQGNAISGANRESADLFDQAVQAFNLYRGDPVALLDKALEVSPHFVMAHLTKAHLYALATEPEASRAAAEMISEVQVYTLSEREASHLAALELLLAKNWSGAALALDRHHERWPHDIVALQAGHLIDFYRASARNLRDRIARVLPSWSENVPGHGVVLGMLAFGLEESADYARAEDIGHRALAAEPRDAWAHHAVAHVMEMQGRASDGIEWMVTRAPHWSGDENFFQIHNWWHKALFHLELGQKEEALALYDERVRRERSDVALDLVDASALLWRLQLADIDVGSRWIELARAWDAHADGELYPFNDWHAAMAYLGAERTSDVARLLNAHARAVGSEVSEWARRTGVDLIEGFRAFWLGDFDEAAGLLLRSRLIANSFGGSHAQRDIIDLTLAAATLRGGLIGTAEAIANERLLLKPHSPVNRAFLAGAKTSHVASVQP